MNFAFIGPQGSGKGTQAKLLADKIKIPTLSVGQLLRDNVESKTKPGLKAQQYMLKGLLVPVNILKEILVDELSKRKYSKGIILDGYPRNQQQVDLLETILHIDWVILISLRKSETIKRLSNRRVCEDCDENYNLLSKKPKKNLQCDKCGGKLVQRKDDTPTAIKKRLEIYKKETGPVIDYYKSQNKVIKINGNQSINKIASEILKKLKEKNLIK